MSSGGDKKANFGRRTWNEEEYAERAKNRRSRSDKDEKRPSEIKSHDFHSSRQKQIDQIDEFNRVSLITSTNSKEAGFYCDTCHRKFKDNLKFLEHLNSKEHLENSGFTEEQSSGRFTLEDVKKRLEYLKKKVSQESVESGVDLKERVLRAKQFEEKKREKRRIKRQQRKRRKLSESPASDEGNGDIMEAMGFASFQSTK